MSYRAIAAAVRLRDVSLGERLVAFSLASYANRDQQAWPSTALAATRAGLARSQYLAARSSLASRGLVCVEQAGCGRGSSSLVSLRFAQDVSSNDAEVNAALFEAVLSHSRTRGSARLLLAALAAFADPIGLVIDVGTAELRAAAGLSDRSYRRAREQLLAGDEVELERVGGGRAKTNQWLVADPRTADGPPVDPRPRRRRSANASDRPLLVSHPRPTAAAAPASEHATTPSAEAREPESPCDGRNPGANPGQIRTPSPPLTPETPANPGPISEKPRRIPDGFADNPGANPGQSRTVSVRTPLRTGPFASETPAKTPAQTPARHARAGREPLNPGTNPPTPHVDPEQTPLAGSQRLGMGDAEQICERFLEAWAPVLGSELAILYRRDRARWIKAARSVGQRHPPDRLRAAFAQMLEDEIIGSQATTLPGFERVVDRLLARRHARQHQPRAVNRPAGDGGWEHARAQLERAIGRHGRDRREAAERELAASDPRLVTFVQRVRWSVLCEQPIRFAERRYRELWSEIASHPVQPAEEVA